MVAFALDGLEELPDMLIAEAAATRPEMVESVNFIVCVIVGYGCVGIG